MKTPKQAPLAFKIVAALFIVSGIYAALEVLVSLANSRIYLNFGVLGIFIGLGLLRFRRGWRTCALVFTWIALVLLPVFALLVLGGAPPSMSSSSVSGLALLHLDWHFSSLLLPLRLCYGSIEY